MFVPSHSSLALSNGRSLRGLRTSSEEPTKASLPGKLAQLPKLRPASIGQLPPQGFLIAGQTRCTPTSFFAAHKLSLLRFDTWKSWCRKVQGCFCFCAITSPLNAARNHFESTNAWNRQNSNWSVSQCDCSALVLRQVCARQTQGKNCLMVLLGGHSQSLLRCSLARVQEVATFILWIAIANEAQNATTFRLLQLSDSDWHWIISSVSAPGLFRALWQRMKADAHCLVYSDSIAYFGMAKPGGQTL